MRKNFMVVVVFVQDVQDLESMNHGMEILYYCYCPVKIVCVYRMDL